jgi:hypothetical protein
MNNFLKFDNKNYTLLNKKRSKSMEDLVNINIKKKAKNSLDAQFDLMTVSGPEEPVPINKPVDDFNFNLRRDVEFHNNYSSFQNSDMHYGVVNREDFIHDNMVPNTSKRDFEVNNGYYQDRKLQAMTGIDDHWKHKKEVENFYDIAKNITYPDGAPVFTSEFEGRYLPNEKLNFQDLPFQNKIKVRPGINGEVQPARNEVYRILPKDVNELRALSNQKVTFEADKVEAVQKGQIRAPDLNLTKYKRNGEIEARETKPNRAQITRESKRPKFKKPSGNRDIANRFKGPAYQNQGNGPSLKKTKHQKSKKVSYDNDPQRNIIEKNKSVNVSAKSFTNYETDRANTSHSIAGVLINTNMGNWVKNQGDVAKTTIRESTELQQRDGNIAHEVKEGYIRHLNDVAKTTIKETTELQQRDGNIANEVKEGYIRHLNDVAKTTIKETTELQQREGNIANEVKEGYIRHLNDVAKTTIKETTELQQREGNIQNRVTDGFIRMLNDKARATIKQSTELQKREGNIQNKVTDGYVRDLNDKARATIKQSTELQKREGNIANEVKDGYVRDLNDKARATIKQSTELQKREGNIANEVKDGYVRTTENVAKPTVKQSTLHSGRGNNYDGNTSTYVRDKDLDAKPTVKQTTLHSGRGNTFDGSTATYVRDKQLSAKPTVKQSTLHSGRGNNYDGNTSTYVRDLKDKAKITIKETTHLKDYTGTLKAEVEKQRTRDDVENMEIDERREILTYNRTPGGKKDGDYVVNYGGFKLRKPINFAHYNHGSIPINNIDQCNNQFSRNRFKTSYIESDYKVNYDFIRTLKNNPLVNDILHPK